MNTTDPFPIDWNEWRAAWNEWRAEHAPEFRRSSYKFGAKNFLADEILGVWSIAERNVELSEVTMPDFGVRPERRVRFVGITFGTGAGNETAMAASFAELEQLLGIGVTA